MKLIEAIELFLGEYIETTRDSYKYPLYDMRDHIGPVREIDTIKPELIIEYVQTVRKRPSIKSPATYNKYVKTMRVFFNWCIKMQLIESSPALAVKRQRQNKSIDRVKAMTDAVYLRLLDYAKWNPRYYALVLFLGDTGCRCGGAATLQWDDVDFEGQKAFVTEKGKPRRPVFFGDECNKALIRWQLQHTGRDGNYVFQLHGRLLKNNSLGQLFERICNRAGIGQWGPHSLRHRKGHALANDKTPPSLAARVLGHDNIMTTINYYYPDDWESVQHVAEAHHFKSKQDTNIIPLRRKVED